MEGCFGQHGWREFHRNRKDILAELDKVLELNTNRPVKTAHGQAVEAYIRKWLTEFLPKKYAVTSGYVIPTLYDDSEKLYHYDIIIYDGLDAPVLWTEGNEDSSVQGKYRAIPAKHVIAIYEVKSRLTKGNVTNALCKLDQTKGFSNQLNKNYSSGIIFIDLKESDNNKESIIKELLKGQDIFGFSGGVVLRYENDDTCTGLISVFDIETIQKEEDKLCKPLAKPIDNLGIYLTEEGNLEIAEHGVGAILVDTAENNWSVSKQYNAMYSEGTKAINLSWSRSGFSRFCIDLLSALEGLPYNDKNKPSFGQVFDKIDRKKAQLQNEYPKESLPFLEISLYEGAEFDKKLSIDTDGEYKIIQFSVEVENQSDCMATISDDSFKTKYELKGRQKAIRTVTFKVKPSDSGKNFEETLKDNGLKISYRLVYYPTTGDKNFYALERSIRITEGEINFVS